MTTHPSTSTHVPATPRALQNQRVIILGGSSGLGLAAAKRAASEGAHVTIVSGNQARIDRALHELPAGSRGEAVDLSAEQNIKRFFETEERFDHLVYTAGENLRLAEISQAELDRARDFFGLRYWGALAAIKYAIPRLNPRGSITLTGGTAGARPSKGWSLASSICGAIEGLVRATAVELAPVRVNAVVPGLIRTNLWDSFDAAAREQLYDSVGRQLLLKRIGEADDVALAYVYLMKQSFVTGQCVIVDGGTVLV